MKVVVFVLSYKNLDDIKSGSIDSMISSAEYDKDNDYSFVFIDNASNDGTVEYVSKEYVEFDVLSTRSNVLYDKAINYGVQYIYKFYNPDYYILVDADNPCKKSCYKELCRYAKDNADAGIIQPLVKDRYDENVLYSCGHKYIVDGGCRPVEQLPKNLSTLANQKSVSFSTTLIKKTVFEKCGLLDDRFLMYYESSDFCFRAKEFEFKSACAVNAVAYNCATKNFNSNNVFKLYFFFRNRMIFWRKHSLEMYNTILDEFNNKYKELKDKYENKCISDPEDFNIYNAILDAKRICEDLSFDSYVVQSVYDYSKKDLLLINRGSNE